jgi:hypothetical protein
MQKPNLAVSIDNFSNKYATYENPVAARDFLKSIAFVIEKEIINNVKDSKNWSIMIDESTCFTVKNLAIVIKYISNHTPVLRYLGMIKLDDCSAGSITNELQQFTLAKCLI